MKIDLRENIKKNIEDELRPEKRASGVGPGSENVQTFD